MSKAIQKGVEILNRYFSSFPQPEALRSFCGSFLLQYNSINPSTNSKKLIRKIFIPENSFKGIQSQMLNPPTLKYEEKPNRIQVSGTWEGWVIDEKLHKDLIQDPLFGSANRSKAGNRWAYVAKVQPEKTKSYFNEGQGNVEYVHDYGEGHPGKTHNGIFVYDLKLKKTFKIPNDGNLVVSSPVFIAEDGSKLIFHAYNRQNFGFGFIHCFNRATSLYVANQEGEQFKVEKLATETRTNMFPAVSKCGNYIAYFSGNGRTHCFYMNITILKKENDKWVSYHEIKDFFIGSYLESRVYFYQVDGKPFFLCQTNEKASNVIYSFNLQTKQLSRVTDNKLGQSYSILSFDNQSNLLAVKYSSPTLATFGYAYLPEPLKLIPAQAVGSFECESYDDPIPHFVLRKQGAGEKQPLVVIIHGGPHGACDPTITASRYLLLESGYTILIPNYSGSVGYGQKHLENALGKIGDVEGQEIVKCVEKLVAENKVNPNKVFSYGGSYGGYMGGILAGKFHKHFAGTVLINPVLSLPFMISTSDIPDWIMVEGLNREDSLDHLTQQDYTKLYKVSPIANPPQIPLAVFVGAKDRRVPHEAAKLYVSMAKSKGIRADLYLYPQSDHKLSDSTETEMDVLLKAYKFMEEVNKEEK